jgi:hypothetical protein
VDAAEAETLKPFLEEGMQIIRPACRKRPARHYPRLNPLKTGYNNRLKDGKESILAIWLIRFFSA